MKQLIFMVAMTLLGTIGVVYRSFWGVAVYYLFATLRPQYLWQWALPEFEWSRYVAIATAAAALAVGLGILPRVPRGTAEVRPRFGHSRNLIALFAFWIFVTYVTARDLDVSFACFVEYIKIFGMMAVSMVLLYAVDQLYYGSSPKRVGRKSCLTASRPLIFKVFLAFPPGD
jgi:hypothetical protein